MVHLRLLLFPLLVGLVTFTGIGAGMARGTMAADGQICAESGPVALVLAHDGLPLLTDDGEAVLLDDTACLDCILGALASAHHAPALSRPMALGDALTLTCPSDPIARPIARAGLARAPPHAA